MHNYTTLEIQSIALLVIFLLYFLFSIRVWFKNLNNKSLLKSNKTLKKLKRLSWDDFELLSMEIFTKQGWKARGNIKKGADGGVDIWMKKRRVSAIVQCKRYDDAVVTIKVVREMYGLMYEHSVDRAYIVTTSRFTKECYKFIESKDIVLIDGNNLVRIISGIS